LIYKLQQRFHVEPLLILHPINSGPAFWPELLSNFLFPSHTTSTGTPSPPPPPPPLPPPCCHRLHCSRTPSTPPPPFQDPTPLGHREELQEPPSVKPPSTLPSDNRLHPGHHVWPPYTPGFTTTSSAPAPCTSTSSLMPLSTSEPCYHRCRPPTGLCRRGEPFPLSFHFPRPFPMPPPLALITGSHYSIQLEC
jgi:hypothetical protein